MKVIIVSLFYLVKYLRHYKHTQFAYFHTFRKVDIYCRADLSGINFIVLFWSFMFIFCFSHMPLDFSDSLLQFTNWARVQVTSAYKMGVYASDVSHYYLFLRKKLNANIMTTRENDYGYFIVI